LPAILAFVIFQLGVAYLEARMLLFIVGVVRESWGSGLLLLLASCGGAVVGITVALVLPRAMRDMGKLIALMTRSWAGGIACSFGGPAVPTNPPLRWTGRDSTLWFESGSCGPPVNGLTLSRSKQPHE
jgi:hypothetical protein